MTGTLILGGTGWLGREIAEQLVAHGDDVTCLARGESGAVPDGVTFIRFDRRTPGAYDLAAWLIGAGNRGLTGIYNAVGSEHDLSTVLLAAAKVAGHTGNLISVDDDWLIEHNVNYWAGPRSLPLWLPRSDSAFAQRSRSRFVAAGGTERNLKEVLEDVLADERKRGLDRQRRSGVTREEENLLLNEIARQIASD
ncbi:hypothetical protein [Cryobacterium sp. Y11]|jgi:hypothetical protein|uniref:hypothetical protein n=1 Tax=Cryobacterium sp. Y11 TaxID=2045016 RepID=UPI000CE4ADA8|nr:hypothetical protein [Cryobacterium sp. Y11]